MRLSSSVSIHKNKKIKLKHEATPDLDLNIIMAHGGSSKFQIEFYKKLVLSYLVVIDYISLG